MCKVIENTGLTLHLVFNLAFACILIEKQLSASAKPVNNQGFILASGFVFKIEKYFFKKLVRRDFDLITSFEAH
jgi:hypothetical protein